MDDREELADLIEYTGTDWESRLSLGLHTNALANEQAEAILESEWLRKHDEAVWAEGHAAPQYRTNLSGDYLGKIPNPYTQK